MSRIVYVYSEQELTPRAGEVISAIKNESGFSDVTFHRMTHPPRPLGPKKVLVFGNKAPEGIWTCEFIHTYSIAQIMSKANAATVLTTSLQLYFNGVHEPPFGENCALYTAGVMRLDNWDFNAPTAIDIETSGNLGKTHTPEEVELLSVALYQEGRPPLVIVSNQESGTESGTVPITNSYQLELLADYLPKFTKAIYHNGKFDTRVLNRILGVKLCVWFDTMLAHHVLNHAAGEHGLKALAMRYYGAKDWESDLKKYTKGGGHYERIPRKILVNYNGWDVYWTYMLWKLFEPQISMDEDNQTAFMLEMSFAELLLDVETYGIPFSVLNAEKLEREESYKRDLALLSLRRIAGNDTFNPNSPQQVKRFLNEDMKLAVSSTSEDTINEILTGNPPQILKDFCEQLIKFRKANKIITTYVKGWTTHVRNSRVHPTFHVHGTTTGRLSSTKPNAQNMPREKSIRKIVSL